MPESEAQLANRFARFTSKELKQAELKYAAILKSTSYPTNPQNFLRPNPN
jgi:hypothetical protein